MSNRIKVGITHGDYNGVGYEVIQKALADERMTELFTPVVFCSPKLWEASLKALKLEMPPTAVIKDAGEAKGGVINLVDLNLGETPLTPGETSPESGKGAVAALNSATAALKAGKIDTLVTAPICKTGVQSADFTYPGHTEYLEATLGREGDKAQMILFADTLRVALVTTHLPVSEISSHISAESIEKGVENLDSTLRMDFGCERPKIAVLSLNPHNGDGGVLGKEEEEIIIPVLNDMKERGLLAFGPYAADGFFGTGSWKYFDAILSMYHDQGLAPFKLLAGEKGVNFTAGLPYVRTSPDHGTAFDIAWQGKADETSMREAIYKSMDILRARENYRQMTAHPLRKSKIERGQENTIE